MLIFGMGALAPLNGNGLEGIEVKNRVWKKVDIWKRSMSPN
jgi:hypothetical protein